MNELKQRQMRVPTKRIRTRIKRFVENWKHRQIKKSKSPGQKRVKIRLQNPR